MNTEEIAKLALCKILEHLTKIPGTLDREFCALDGIGRG